MKALSMILIFGGYMLIYAATAKQGKFATEPWAGLFADAYDTDPSGVTTIRQTSSGPAPVPSGFSPLVSGAQSGLPASTPRSRIRLPQTPSPAASAFTG